MPQPGTEMVGAGLRAEAFTATHTPMSFSPRARRLAIIAAAAGVALALVFGVPRLRGPSPAADGQPAAGRQAFGTAAAPAGSARSDLDRGNAEFRAGRYDVALAHYRAAAREAPTSAAPYFGVYMAARKVGNTQLADSAQAEIAKRIDTSSVPRDSATRASHPTVSPH